jgi:hypothetical protein
MSLHSNCGGCNAERQRPNIGRIDHLQSGQCQRNKIIKTKQLCTFYGAILAIWRIGAGVFVLKIIDVAYVVTGPLQNNGALRLQIHAVFPRAASGPHPLISQTCAFGKNALARALPSS